MSLPPEAQQALTEEERTLADVLTSLKEQKQRGSLKLQMESTRARTLTSELVAARRAEDKAMLASDEAVSHGLKDQKKAELTGIEKLLAKPYFARLVVEEEMNGQLKQLEYRIGFTANSDCRILDWRKAPISKLYYEYRENDDYSEQILGRERNGTVVLRNTVEIEKQELKKVTCRYGSFSKSGSEWIQVGANQRSQGAGTLRHILSLITPEQFRLITEDASTAILIQGIAGSGKTTVALHRLAWLLHEDNSDLTAVQCVVLVFSSALKRYVSGTLPSIDVEGVEVLTFQEWAARSVARAVPHLLSDPITFRRPADRVGLSIARVKRSLALLRVLEEEVAALPPSSPMTPEELVLRALSRIDRIIALDETRLIDRELVKQALERAKRNHAEQVTDFCDDALLVRAVQLTHRGVNMAYGSYGHYGHIVADEVQDMSVGELACVIGAVKDTNHLTLVGDTAQKVSASSSFPGWEKLQQSCSLKDSMSKYISLTISHRSTLQIMRFADYIQQRNLVTDGRPGRPPLWYRCDTETSGITSALKWLNLALEKHPGSLVAVICATPEEAKFAFGLLRPSFGSGIRLGDESSFSFDEGIIVTDAAQVKGLEFLSVMIWNPSARAYPAEQESRNLLYIAASRAEEHLCIVTWGRSSPILPPPSSKLVRDFPVEEAPEEPENDGKWDRIPS